MIDIMNGYVAATQDGPNTVLGGILSIICLIALLFTIWDIFFRRDF